MFAYHPDSPDDRRTRNLGETCRLIADHSRRPDGTSTFDSRFNRLLSCDREEIGERLRPVILAAKAKGIPVNYEELFSDYWYWGDKVKARWAREYWGAPAEAETVATTEVAP
jgi:CRISPR type I-E-associated protein CasB/Cse2